MKRNIVILILMSFMICLTGCKSSDVVTTGATSENILLVAADLSDHFIGTIAEQAKGYAESNNIQLTVEDSENTIETQVSQIKAAKKEGYGAVICIPVDTDTSLQLVEAADELPLVFVNRCPDEDLLERGKCVYVGSDDRVAGTYQAEYLASHFSGKNSIKAVLFQGERGQSSVTGRTEAVKEGLKEAGIEVEYIFEDTAGWSRQTAKEMFETFLTLGEKYDCVISNNDEMALGVIEACKEEKIDPTGFLIVGIDATEEGCQAVQEGTMAFTVRQSAEEQGKYSVMAAERLIQGKELKGMDYVTEDECYIWIPFEKVDKNSLNS